MAPKKNVQPKPRAKQAQVVTPVDSEVAGLGADDDVVALFEEKRPNGKNTFAVRQNRFCRTASLANAANVVMPHYKARRGFSSQKYMLGVVLVYGTTLLGG